PALAGGLRRALCHRHPLAGFRRDRAERRALRVLLEGAKVRGGPRAGRRAAARFPVRIAGGMNLALRVISGASLLGLVAAALWIGLPAVAVVVAIAALIGAREL